MIDVIGESSTKLRTKTLESALGGKVNSIVWCKNFFPLSWCCTKNSKPFLTPQISEYFTTQ